jgi:hypothetical protein
VSAPELVRRFVLPLEGLGFPYMVTGPVAAMAYGEPRLTNDVDVVIALKPQDAKRFCSDLDRWALGRRRREPVGEGAVWVAPPEYVVIRKLEFYRMGGHPKHPAYDLEAALAGGAP